MEWVFSYVRDLLNWFGFDWSKEAKLLFLGLDNAGKTTLLCVLKTGTIRQFSPTLYPTAEQVRIGNVNCTCHDLGGHDAGRRVWSSYYPSVSGIVFVVDAADESRINESREELNKVLSNPHISDVPILILGNKIDRPSALPEGELRHQLGLNEFTTGKNPHAENGNIRPIELFMSSFVYKQGFPEGFRWLSKYL